MVPPRRRDTPPGYALGVETVTDEPRRSRHWLQLVVLAALLITGLLGMHALVGRAPGAGARLRALRRRHDERRLRLCLRAYRREHSGPRRSVRPGCAYTRLCALAGSAVRDASPVRAGASGAVDLPNVSIEERRCGAPQPAISAGSRPCRACHDTVSKNAGPSSEAKQPCASDHP